MPRLGHVQSRSLLSVLVVGALLILGGASRADAQTYSDAKARLIQAVTVKNFRAATIAADDLVALGSTQAIETLISIGLKGDYYGLEQYIYGKLQGIPPGAVFDRICELASEDKNANTRVFLTLLLGNIRDSNAFKAVLQNLYDPDDGVVLAALEKLGQKDHVGSIGHLIEALEYQEKKNRSDGLIAYEIRKLLLQLTREDIVRSVDWKNWWKPRVKGFVRPPEREDRGKKVTSVYKEPSVFVGIEVPADRVVFIIDVSGSMLIKDPAPEATGDGGGSAAGGSSGGTSVGGKKKDPPKKPKVPQEEIPESRQRLRRVQKELIETIERLPENAQFNVIWFNQEVGAFSEDLVPANARNKTKAINFVRAFKAEGETYTDHALLRAFETNKLRAIFLLSDGAPKRDDERLPVEPILEWVREANRFARVRVHTIGFEQAGSKMRKFMSRLAGQNHGEYVELK